MNEAVHGEPGRSPPLDQPLSRRGYGWALIVLVGAVAFVMAIWMIAREREMNSARAEFVASSERTVSLLVQRLNQYEL
ncbi:hypothetical protein O6471_24220, partial [Salmonella enterica subsp. enterica]